MSKYIVPNKYNGEFIDGRSRYNSGGGSGGGEREATAEEKRLWAAQAGALEGMTEISMPTLQTGMNNLGTLANESMDGTLAARLRGMAGADASAALGQGLTGATQKLERYGATMNPNALAAEMATTALKGAGLKARSMNEANMGAEDLKWNRNAALTGLASGQGAQAISGMGSLAGQIGQNRQANMQADAQSMQGLGMMGAWAGNKFFADGGEVRMANGGLTPFKPTSLSFAPWEISGADGYQGPSTMQKIGAVATPMAMMAGADAAKPYVKSGIDAVKGLFGSKAAGAGSAANPEAVNFGIDAASSALNPEAAAFGVETATDVGATAAAAGAEGAGLGSALGAVGTALPWIGGALALASILDLADGGLARRNFTPGGEVDGPGTETSDSIPARLSDGEYVLNAEAVKIVGKDKLDEINNMGLRRRGQEPAMACGGKVRKMAGGGFLYGLGQAARGFVPTAMQLDQQDEQKKQWEAQNKRADAAESRANTQFKWAEGEHQRKLDIQAAGDAHNKKWAEIFSRANQGDYTDVPGLVKSFNNQEGAFNDGTTLTFQSTPQGTMMHQVGADGKVLSSKPLNHQTILESLQQAALAEKATLLGGDMAGYVRGERDYGLKGREVGTKEEANRINEGYRADMVGHYGNQLSETIRHNKAVEGLTRSRIAASGTSGTGNPLNKARAARMEEMDKAEDDFYAALESGDYRAARQHSNRLGNSFDSRGVIKMKRATADGGTEEVLQNKFDLMIDRAAARDGQRQADELTAGLKKEYPKARFDGVAVDVETGERYVVSGKTKMPLADFIAMQDKKAAPRGLGVFSNPSAPQESRPSYKPGQRWGGPLSGQ